MYVWWFPHHTKQANKNGLLVINFFPSTPDRVYKIWLKIACTRTILWLGYKSFSGEKTHNVENKNANMQCIIFFVVKLYDLVYLFKKVFFMKFAKIVLRHFYEQYYVLIFHWECRKIGLNKPRRPQMVFS